MYIYHVLFIMIQHMALIYLSHMLKITLTFNMHVQLSSEAGGMMGTSSKFLKS